MSLPGRSFKENFQIGLSIIWKEILEAFNSFICHKKIVTNKKGCKLQRLLNTCFAKCQGLHPTLINPLEPSASRPEIALLEFGQFDQFQIGLLLLLA